VFLNYTATWRGFDTFFGTRGNTNNYWQHTEAGTGGFSKARCSTRAPLKDFIDCRGKEVALAPEASFGVYDSKVLSDRALSIVAQHSLADSLYVYLAYHNVHGPMEAPRETVFRLSHIKYDRRKVADAMLTELDYGVGNITGSMKSRGMWNSSLVIFHTDNGGPEDHDCNFPMRGYKFGVWEGSVRGVAFVSGARPFVGRTFKSENSDETGWVALQQVA
jgi:arylsulfatase A-like enzyme